MKGITSVHLNRDQERMLRQAGIEVKTLDYRKFEKSPKGHSIWRYSQNGLTILAFTDDDSGLARQAIVAPTEQVGHFITDAAAGRLATV